MQGSGSSGGRLHCAIKVLEGDEGVHMLLADVQMPVGTPNGVTIARMARLRRHKLPIVFMTGFYDPEELGAIEPVRC
jgi:CheY-like chemotaxis protein